MPVAMQNAGGFTTDDVGKSCVVVSLGSGTIRFVGVSCVPRPRRVLRGLRVQRVLRRLASRRQGVLFTSRRNAARGAAGRQQVCTQQRTPRRQRLEWK